MKHVLLSTFFILALMGTNAKAQEMNSFAAIDVNSPAQMDFALLFAEKVMQTATTSQFTILCGGEGIHLLHNDTSPAKSKIAAYIEKYPTLKFFVCEETTDKMNASLGGESLDFIPGVEIAHCGNKFNQMIDDGWYRIDTAEADN